MVVDWTILMPAGFPMPHLKAYAPNFSGNMWKMPRLSKLGVPAPSKVSLSGIVILKISVFEAVFWRKSLFWLTLTKWRPPLNIHGWKAMDLSFPIVFLKIFFWFCKASELLVMLWQIYVSLFWEFVLRNADVIYVLKKGDLVWKSPLPRNFPGALYLNMLRSTPIIRLLVLRPGTR